MGMIEMVMAVVLITVALLALMASYDGAFTSLHKSARTNAAAALGESQLELYNAVYGDTTTTTTVSGTTTTTTLPLAQVGLSSSLLTTAKANDAYYATDEAALSPSGTDVTSASCTTTIAQCEPVQVLTGLDGKTYRVETFIRDVSQSLTCTTATTTTTTCSQSALERDVTVIVRDGSTTGAPKVWTATAAFDCGPRSGTTTTTDWCPS